MPEALVLISALRNGFMIPSPIDTWSASRYPTRLPRYGTTSPKRLLNGGLGAKDDPALRVTQIRHGDAASNGDANPATMYPASVRHHCEQSENQ